MADLAVGSIIITDNTVIPSGWHICDGSSGSIPDLRGYFCRGASITTGSGISQEDWSTHTHPSPTMDTKAAHVHTVYGGTTGTPSSTNSTKGNSGTNHASSSHDHNFWSSSVGSGGGHTHTLASATTAEASCLPPHIKLFFIIKVA